MQRTKRLKRTGSLKRAKGLRKKRRAKKRDTVDKAVLAIGTRKKIMDNGYRKSFKDRTCEASRNGIDLCGQPAIGAHVRTGEVAGTGTKPSDDLIAALCSSCHSDQEANPGAEWWLENVLKPQLRRQYREWKTK